MTAVPPVFAAFDWSVENVAIAVVVLAAVVGVVYVALRVFGVTIPAWVIQIFWICVAAVVAVVAIRFVAGLF